MKLFKNNLLVQFSITSFVVMTTIALVTATLLTATLDRNIAYLEDHGAAMMSGTMIKPTDPFSIPSLAQDVRNLQWTTVATLGSGFLILYATLFGIVWGGWRTINKQRAQLQLVNTELETSLEELRESNKKLEQSNQELQEFASIAAHDLQEPLRKVEAFGDRLAVKCGDLLTEQGRDYLSRMRNAAGRMRTLIDDVLTFSRVTTKGERFTPIDLNQVAQEVLSDLEVHLEQVGGRVEVDDLPTIDGDPIQMRQLFQNLIGNALKFHQPEAPPVVKIHSQRIKSRHDGPEGGYSLDELCEIIVEDNGIGFEDKYLDRLFTIFQRLHGRGDYEGNGVGLAVCRKIAERHGGNITAKGDPGEGATFIVTLPTTHLREVDRE